MAIDKVMSTSKPPVQQINHNREIASVTERLQQQKDMYKKENEENQPIKRENIEAAVETLNQFIEPIRTNLKFELHDKLEKYFVKVVDTDSGDVIKEIPPEKMLDMYAAMAEFMGFLIDKKV